MSSKIQGLKSSPGYNVEKGLVSLFRASYKFPNSMKTKNLPGLPTQSMEIKTPEQLLTIKMFFTYKVPGK